MTAEELCKELLQYPTLRKLIINGPPQAFYGGVSELLALIGAYVGSDRARLRELVERWRKEAGPYRDGEGNALDRCARELEKAIASER